MRNIAAVVVGGLLAAGCASMSEQQDPAMVEPLPGVVIYDVPPSYAVPLGPVNISLCDGTRQMATRKLQEMVAAQNGNGLTQLVCREEGISLSCWKTAVCDAVALNVPPPPPPKPVPPKGKPKPKPKPKQG